MDTEAATGEVDSGLFRHVVGHLASGVTVVTTRDGQQDFGMTASSVTSLSVDPPMMLACVNNLAPTAAAISSAGRYAVNVLGQGSEDLAYQFATPSADKFAGVEIERAVDGTPLIASALANFVCEVTEQVVGGTHTIFLGHVVEAAAREGAPLTYFRGDFGRFEFQRNDEVYERLRDMVLSRVFAADEVLRVEELADRLEQDRATVFYALTKMASEDLIRRDPARGYVVQPFDVRTSNETFEARLAIELGVIDTVVGRVTADRLAEIRLRYEAMTPYLVGDRFSDFHAYLDANYAFHEAVVALADNSLLNSTFGLLSIKNVMSRSFGATSSSSAAFLDVQREMLEGLENGDADRTRLAARGYCEMAKSRARELLELTGGQI